MTIRNDIKIDDLFDVVHKKQDLLSISDFAKILNTTEHYIKKTFKDKLKRNELKELMYYYYNNKKESEIKSLVTEGLSKYEIGKIINYRGNIKDFNTITLQKLVDSNEIKRYCNVCGSSIKTVFGNFLYCSYSCSRTYASNINKTQKNINITKSLNDYYKLKPTKINLKKDLLKRLKEDLNFAKEYNKKLKEKRSLAGKKSYDKAVRENKFIGWKSRNKSSYAELFWQNVLDNNNIKYVKEYKILKKDLDSSLNNCYFLDFYININGFMIDLEIDGKQHQYKERVESDKIRDNLLKRNNYIVYRIPWVNPNNDINKKIVKRQISNFINFILKYYI